jgi:lipopolysaccharide/colanic/teichoic acid biosynthesis glycosyltransferase
MKRTIDVIGAAVGLLLTAPLLGVAALAIRLTMGRPVLFRQARPGRAAQIFTLHKLRTMIDETDSAGHARPCFSRVTPLGRLLRTTSIDELPQLWNVLKGDMSLVGPRPLLTQYLPRYNAVQRRRHEMRPGITGWAQIHRRTAVTWDDRLRLDVWYVDHWTLWLDVMILVRTLRDMFSADGNPSMESLSRTTANELEFKGTSGGTGGD